MNEVILFMISMLIPFIYYRSLYYVYSSYFKISGFRKRSGLQVHHIHYGMILILISSFVLLIYGKNVYTIALLGFGLGFSLDEFVPALLMPGNRKVELEAYEKGFIPTLVMLLIIVILLLLIRVTFN